MGLSKVSLLRKLVRFFFVGGGELGCCCLFLLRVYPSRGLGRLRGFV